jgi:hypothetical protein
VVPPSIEMSAPLMYDASSEARNAASLATSSGSPKRPLGIVANSDARAASSSASMTGPVGGCESARD